MCPLCAVTLRCQRDTDHLFWRTASISRRDVLSGRRALVGRAGLSMVLNLSSASAGSGQSKTRLLATPIAPGDPLPGPSAIAVSVSGRLRLTRAVPGRAGSRSRGRHPLVLTSARGPMRNSWRGMPGRRLRPPRLDYAALERARQGDLDSVHGGAGPHVARGPGVQGVDVRVVSLELWPAALRGERDATGEIL